MASAFAIAVRGQPAMLANHQQRFGAVLGQTLRTPAEQMRFHAPLFFNANHDQIIFCARVMTASTGEWSWITWNITGVGWLGSAKAFSTTFRA